jgi:PIN domain nuclease of toxin-antitoxin system
MKKRLLLDTNVFLYWTAGGKKLSARARKAIENPNCEVLLSAVSSWEIAIKHALGKLSLPDLPAKFVPSRMSAHAISGLAFEHSDALAIGSLPDHHDDPFDRALIAQARERNLPIVSSDTRFEDYGVPVVW